MLDFLLEGFGAVVFEVVAHVDTDSLVLETATEERKREFDKHAAFASEEVFDFVEWHVVGVGGSAKSPPNKVATRVSRDNSLKLREIFWIEFIIFNKVSSCFSVCVCG